ncbi:hypothetical protein [Cohnella cholangitidis]|uniref:Uncharacterized protein n=1 Tax=Cohnella cholangitidis TaxID=2598458 RepID=A0A7G5C401_9BACL|nr:hypothetical protein [Cohnella cholangitidis]QMV43935.1 hypothetical protein FPL14_24245 [Cohnella cholangitidis]
MSQYRLSLGDLGINWGTAIDIEERVGYPSNVSVKRSDSDGVWDWDLPDGIYRAKDIVRELGTLLEAIHVQLGAAADAEALLSNIQATLAVAGRETSLPVGSLIIEDKARNELSRQADRIGTILTGWAREFNSRQLALKKYGETVLGSLVFRSRCDHHLWTHKVTDLLTGPSGGPAVMQLFNEYLHQIVLLRDALIPFDNWGEVPIELRDRRVKGLREMEQAHSGFIAEIMVRPISHQTLVRYAQSVLGTSLTTAGYGFQYRLGTIIPASLAVPLAEAPAYLLRWYPVRTVEADSNDGQAEFAFDYAYPDYYSAPRSHAGSGTPVVRLGGRTRRESGSIGEAYLRIAGREADRVVLDYGFRIDSTDYSVDLGQALRGHRFKYRPQKGESDLTRINNSDIFSHDATDILRLTDLVTCDSGIHLIDTGGNELVRWALLGKLYPENVIVLDRGDSEEIALSERAGKGFGAKFLIH